MKWKIPGTVLEMERQDAQNVEELFSSMFLAGGMVLSQVANITGLEPYTIQNWVKRGFLAPPQCKRYSMSQLCRIININMLKGVLPMEKICGLMTYINGDMDDASDDIIDDAALYFLFVRLCAQIRQLTESSEQQQLIRKALKDYQEPVPGAKARIEKALAVMLMAWMTARMRAETEELLNRLES